MSRMIVSSDSDLTMCAGAKSAQVKHFKHDAKIGSISDTSLIFRYNELATTNRNKLHYLGDDKVNLKLADYELFSKRTSFETRALIGSCLGHDISRVGCQGVGIAKLNDSMQGTNDDNLHVDDQMMMFACAKLSTDPKVVETCVQATICEPVDEMKKLCGLHEKFTCLHENPTKVHHHTKDFAHPNDNDCIVINDEVCTLQCKGCDTTLPHTYLIHEKKSSYKSVFFRNRVKNVMIKVHHV